MVLNDKEIRWLAALTDVIIPRTDTPGASDVGVPAFSDAFLRHAPTEVDAFRLGMRAFDETSRELTGMAFDELDPSRQVGVVTQLSKQPTSSAGAFSVQVKGLTIDGYYTRRRG